MSHDYVSRRRQYFKKACELINQVTSNKKGAPKSLKDEFKKIVAQLNILKKNYLPTELQIYPELIALNILDFPFFMYNHCH